MPEPVVRWTPAEGWLMTEIARRSLTLSLDGGPFAHDSDRCSVAVLQSHEETWFEISIDASHAVLRLEPIAPSGHRWRAHWFLDVARDDERWVLSEDQREATISDARRSPVIVRLRLQQRALQRDLGGAPDSVSGGQASEQAIEQVPLSDVACHKYTRQSTVDESPTGDLAPWSAPTAAERAPWWELDLVKSMYVAWLRVDLALPERPPNARVVIRAYAFVMPDGSPPADSVVFEAPLDQLAIHDGHAAIGIAADVVARLVRVELVAPDGQTLVLAVTAAEVLAAELTTDSLASTLRRSFALFRDRPLVVALDGTSLATYGELWTRAASFSRGMAKRCAAIAHSGSQIATDASDAPGVPSSLGVSNSPNASPDASSPNVPPMLRDRGVLAILLRSRVEWLVADLAGLMRGYVSVPISPDETDDRLALILSRAPATVIVCEAADAARLARIAPRALVIACDDPSPAGFDAVLAEGEQLRLATSPHHDLSNRHPSDPRREDDLRDPPERDPDDLYAVLFTSGSTGAPKGAMRTYRTFFAMVASYQVGHSPRHLSFQPLSHLSERMYLPSLMIHGGTIAFSRGGAHLLDELRAFGPTTVGSVPRLFEVLHASYRRRLRALLAAEPTTSRGELERRALAEARAAFGSRLSAISIGSAPVSAEVFGFLKRCFADIWVSEGYGSTEVGTIATDGKIADHANVKLVPLPGTDDPDRGEIWVKSPHAIAGYLGDDEATKAAFDGDGYFATGDLGQRDADGKIRVVGRLRNTVKLAQGEFVSAERIETALAACPLVDRIYVHAASGAVGVAAVVVPHADVLERGLAGGIAPNATNAEAHVLAALRAAAKTAGLAPYETPRGVILERGGFTVESGLVTPNGKLARAALAARYASQLAALVAGAPEPAEHAPASTDDDLDAADLRARVVRVATQAIGRPLTIDEPLASAGVDSLASAEILAALSDELGRDVPLTWWFEARTLGDLATRLARFADVAGPAQLRDLASADLALPPITSVPSPVVPSTSGSSPMPVPSDSSPVATSPSTVPLDASPSPTHPSGDDVRTNVRTNVRTSAPERGPRHVSSTSEGPPRHVLLTGATGFLGAHLVGELVARDIAVTCLVRAPDDAAARIRLRDALASRRLPLPDGVRAIAGDLAPPHAWANGTLEGIDGIVHAGATVSWLASYEALRAPNVLGTYALLELAARRGWPFHHVSTISTAPRDGDESSALTFDQALAGTPYGLSKWIAEQHVMRASLATTIYRPAMIAGHTRSGVGNPDDFTCRYLAGCIELGIYVDRDDAIMDMTPVDHVAAAIAALVTRPATGEVHHLTNIGGSLSFGAVGRALAASGRAVRPATYAEFRDVLQRSKTSRLHALGAFFPTTFSLGSGPWPSAKSLALLSDVGQVPPKIDEAIIARYVEALARDGHVR